MRKLIIMSLFVIQILSCGMVFETEPEFPIPEPYVASDLAPYVNEFFNYATFYDYQYKETLRTEWRDDLGKSEETGNTTIGLCSTFTMEGDYIKSVGPFEYDRYPVEEIWQEVYILDQEKWSESTKIDAGNVHVAYLRWVVFHELGHCSLGLPHSSDPFSIMNPTLFRGSPECIDKYWPDMVKYLFERGPSVHIPKEELGGGNEPIEIDF